MKTSTERQHRTSSCGLSTTCYCTQSFSRGERFCILRELNLKMPGLFSLKGTRRYALHGWHLSMLTAPKPKLLVRYIAENNLFKYLISKMCVEDMVKKPF